MSRLNDFIKFDNQLQDDIAQVLEEQGVTCDLYRTLSSGGSAGFDTELVDTFIERGRIYYAPSEISVQDVNDTHLKASKNLFNGITNMSGIQLNDKMIIEGVSYRVKEVDRTVNRASTSILLERI